MTKHLLVKYLENLNSPDMTWGLWVNPNNLEEFRIGEFCNPNGGRDDAWICVGTLDSLSCANQSWEDGLRHYLHIYYVGSGNSKIRYNDRKVMVYIAGIEYAWVQNTLDPTFREFLVEEILYILKAWAEYDAWLIVGKLKERFTITLDCELPLEHHLRHHYM